MSECASTLKIEQSKEVIQLLLLLREVMIGKLQLHIQINDILNKSLWWQWIRLPPK